MGTPRLQVRAVLLSQPACSIAMAVLCSSHVEAEPVAGKPSQYPTDLFLLPVLLQVISHDEREHENHFYLTFSLCWVNPEEDGGTQ